jgi:hypothetical protein
MFILVVAYLQRPCKLYSVMVGGLLDAAQTAGGTDDSSNGDSNGSDNAAGMTC